jgi:hypothetical protein
MKSRPVLSDADLERALLSSRDLADAPEHVIHRAIAVFMRPTAAVPKPGILRRLAAVLSFDSGDALPLAFGQRSSGGSVRQLLFTVEGRDIDLRVVPGAEQGSFALSGQILGPDRGGSVRVRSEAGHDLQSCELSDMGEFKLPPVSSGTYVLTLEVSDLAIDLPPVRIPQAA